MIVSKLALRADVWYNGEVNTVVSGSASNTPDRISLDWRLIMDSLPQKPLRGKCNLKPSRQLSPFCIDCGEEDQSKFYYRPDGTRKGNVCKTCANKRIYAKKYNHNTEACCCPDCGKKDPQQFRYKSNGYRNGNLCMACQNKQKKQFRQDMPLELKEQVKANAREAARRRCSTKEQRDQLNERARQLYSSEKRIARGAKRRASKMQAGGNFTITEWEALKAQYHYTCLRCGRREPEIKLTPDHVIPISKLGTSNIENIQPLCFSCNSAKCAKIIDYRTHEKGNIDDTTNLP
jgi:5-methylcytosine-specific restriction endonuclease McrA